MSGLLITGTHAHCGKTVATAGLVGSLRQVGFRAQALKPLRFHPPMFVRRGYEQHFFDRILPPLHVIDFLSAESPERLPPVDWQRFLTLIRKQPYPYLLESPDSLASPIRYQGDTILDSIDLATLLEIPILLVTTKQRDTLSLMRPMTSYLEQRGANVIGWLAVDTQHLEVPDWEVQVLRIRQHTLFPYLGEIAYSPSISVEAFQQGNLLRLTEQGIDLLPVQQALQLSLPI